MPVTWGSDQLGRWWVQDVTGTLERATSAEGAWLRAVHLAMPRGDRAVRASFSLPEDPAVASPPVAPAAAPPVLPEPVAPVAVLPTGADAQAAYLDRPAREIVTDVRSATRDPLLAAELAMHEAASANRKTVLAALAEHTE